MPEVAATVAEQGEGAGGVLVVCTGHGAGLSGVGGDPNGRKGTPISIPAVTTEAPFTFNLAFPECSLLIPP